jgi:hypothetical protein
MTSPSSLSVAARTLRTHLAGAVGLPEGQILIGHPSLAAKDVESETNKQFLNLFFYRVEHGAYPADSTSDAPFYVRFYCLVTALGTKETVNGGTISAGENDLRLVGGVMQGLHESPILMLQDEADEDVAQMQVVLHVLSLDDLNHIWSTQGDTPYRLSVGYELALLPLPLAHPSARGPRVGSIGIQTQGSTAYTALPADGLSVGTRAPQVPAVRVNGVRPDWTPHICWLAGDGSLQYSLAFAADALPASLKVIPLGAPGAEVRLGWEIWNPEEADPSWQPDEATPANLTVATDRLRPAQAEPSLPSLAQDLAFPLSARGQAMLYASRDYTRPDGTVVVLHSNPLLVSVHEDGP